MKSETPLGTSEKYRLASLFFLLALGAMSLAPRLPDIKANLNIPNGQFGTLVGSGALGALVSQFIAGHIVHRFGVRKPLTWSVIVLYSTLSWMVHIHSPLLYFIVNICNGASWSLYHISINAQGLHRQKYSEKQVLPMMHGLWTTGAITTIMVAFLLANHVGVALHINTLCAINFVITLIIIYSLRDRFMLGDEDTDEVNFVSIRHMIKSFNINWFVSIGFLCSLMLEVSLGDWSTIYTKERLDVSKSVAVIPYFFFMLSMVFGRLYFNRFRARWSEQTMIRYFPLLGGIGFLIPYVITQFIADTHKNIALILTIIGFICGGVGSSFLAPLYFVIVGRKSDKPGGVAVAELGALQQILGFGMRVIIAWVAQVSLPIALYIPAILLIISSFFARVGSPNKSA